MPVLMPADDRRSVTLRLTAMQYAVAAVFAALAVGFWVIQVAQHAKYQELAENNHQRRLPLRAPRGVLFDRHDAVLVQNRDAFNISIVREQTDDLDRTVRLLARVTGVDEAGIRDILNRRRREPLFRPIVVIEDATEPQRTAVYARKVELEGVLVEETPTRKYPTDALAAHLFGYVGEVNEAQLARDDYEGLESGAIVGHAGVEAAYNRLLMGKDGNKYVVVNSRGREIRWLFTDYPVEGRRLQLTIDYDVQRAAEEAFKTYDFAGAAVILDPANGEVLGLVSLPAYDPNAFAGGIDRDTWADLNTDELRPLQNRALQGMYSPGSTFKMAVAVAALEEGVVSPSFRVSCSGGAMFYGRRFGCWKRDGHGSVDMRHAIEQSCNVYFYTIGNMLSVDQIHKWSTALGLGVKTGIDLPNEKEGLIPSTEWKRRTHGERWYPGETISVAIGQGQVTVTPLSMATYIATLATGTRRTPHVLKAVDDGEGWQPVPTPEPKATVHLKPQTVEAIRDGLWLVVNGAGTGGRSRLEGRDVVGKTGTSQVISLAGARAAAGKMDVRDHHWFVFFAPRDNPQIAGVIFAEHGGPTHIAPPIAKHVLETFFAKRDGLPLPVLKKPGPTVIAAASEQAPAPPAAGRPPGGGARQPR
jgi:penicillin-binding protein 2